MRIFPVLEAERYEVKNKGYVGLLCLVKLVLHQKLTKNDILLGLNLSRFTQNQINLPQEYLKITGHLY